MQNKPLVFLDTETTDLEEGRLIELAYTHGDTIEVIRCKPPVTISTEAMSVHHITPGIIAHLPSFEENPFMLYAKNTIESGIVVAHNAPFDIAVLKREGIEVGVFIDTMRLASHLYPEIPKINLQYLRYYFELYLSQEAVPHSAEGDVRVLQAVFGKLIQKIVERIGPDEDPIEYALTLTNEVPLLTHLTFGKHYGKTYREVNEIDRGYIEWLHKNPSDNEDVRHTVKHWMGRRSV